MVPIIRQKTNRILFASFFFLLILANGPGAEAEDHPKFTIETHPAAQGPVDSNIWAIGDSIRIVEPLTLPNSCDGVDGTVDFHNYDTEISVKLKPKGMDLSTGNGCTQVNTPVVVSVTIPNMPFVPGCHHYITLETPQRVTTHTVRILW
ncbi:MAG TPA: hypothetical protein VMN77_11460 [Nitrospiria bacterium]|jgi:hypothetical protein|nr:hypothetical protein [Nitrospiria bacterium]